MSFQKRGMIMQNVLDWPLRRPFRGSIRNLMKSSGLALTFALFAQNASAQVCDGFPVDVLSFTGATLSSGTNLQPGAVYDFANVTPGVDAQLEIISFNNGASLANIDNDGLLTSNLNPQIIPNPAGGGHVRFRVSYLNAATGTPQPISFSVTQIDVDGDSGTLREFVEFEDNLAQFTVDQTTELVINASGPSSADVTRFESTTSATAPGIDPTAQENVVRAIYTNVTSFDYTYGTLGAGTTTRLASSSFDCPIIPNPVNTIPQADSDLVTVKALAAGSSATPDIGDTVTYEITVTNDGPDAATNITLSDGLPAGLTATGNNGTVTAGTYVGGNWNIGILLNGQSAVLTLEGTVDSDQGGNAITNTLAAPASSDSLDPSTAGDDLTETINVQVPVIEAVDNDFTAVPLDPAAGGATTSVFDNDTLNGDPVDAAAVTVSINDDGRLLGAAINPDGTIDVPAGTAPGIYEVEYEICDVNDPTNCDTAVATIAVVGAVNSIANPTVCGAWNTQGWITYGSPASQNQVTFNSGNYANDPYVYLPMSRAANGRIITNFGTPVATDSGAIPTRPGAALIASSQTAADHQSELNSFVYRLEGAPNTSETITFDTVNAAEFTAHWVEDSAGNVLSSQDFLDTRSTVDGDNFPVMLNYPADGTLFLHAAIFDPTFGYGRPDLPDYECPAPSLAMTKVADNPGPHNVGDVITYTYTITNDGNRPIQDVVINDTHNGSDPAPTPGTETLLTDAAPVGDSTDAATNGSWDILGPGDVVTFTGTYTVTATDVDNL